MPIKSFEQFTTRMTDPQKDELREKAIDVWRRFCIQHEGKYYNPQHTGELKNTVLLNKFKFLFSYENTDEGLNIHVCVECIDYYEAGKMYIMHLVGEEAEHGAEEDELKDLTAKLFLNNSTEK